jgi:hypothetical protein
LLYAETPQQKRVLDVIWKERLRDVQARERPPHALADKLVVPTPQNETDRVAERVQREYGLPAAEIPGDGQVVAGRLARVEQGADNRHRAIVVTDSRVYVVSVLPSAQLEALVGKAVVVEKTAGRVRLTAQARQRAARPNIRHLRERVERELGGIFAADSGDRPVMGVVGKVESAAGQRWAIVVAEGSLHLGYLGAASERSNVIAGNEVVVGSDGHVMCFWPPRSGPPLSREVVAAEAARQYSKPLLPNNPGARGRLEHFVAQDGERGWGIVVGDKGVHVVPAKAEVRRSIGQAVALEGGPELVKLQPVSRGRER